MRDRCLEKSNDSARSGRGRSPRCARPGEPRPVVANRGELTAVSDK